MPYIREDMASISVSVNKVAYGLSWATAEGGDLEADDSKTRPGGMGREVSAGGPASRSDMTVAIQHTDAVTLWHATLENLVGVGRVSVGWTWLGPDRTPTGVGGTIQGILKGVTRPSVDAGSSDVGMYELVISCDEQAA